MTRVGSGTSEEKEKQLGSRALWARLTKQLLSGPVGLLSVLGVRENIRMLSLGRRGTGRAACGGTAGANR
jgi:hypothetical protein